LFLPSKPEKKKKKNEDATAILKALLGGSHELSCQYWYPCVPCSGLDNGKVKREGRQALPCGLGVGGVWKFPWCPLCLPHKSPPFFT
jgi:hypothetical protein